MLFTDLMVCWTWYDSFLSFLSYVWIRRMTILWKKKNCLYSLNLTNNCVRLDKKRRCIHEYTHRYGFSIKYSPFNKCCSLYSLLTFMVKVKFKNSNVFGFKWNYTVIADVNNHKIKIKKRKYWYFELTTLSKW